MPATEARFAALQDLGGVEQIKEECRDMRRTQGCVQLNIVHWLSGLFD